MSKQFLFCVETTKQANTDAIIHFYRAGLENILFEWIQKLASDHKISIKQKLKMLKDFKL